MILSTAYPDVAFVSDMEAVQTFTMYAGYQLSDLVVSESGGSRTFTLPNGASVVFDYARKMMAFSDYASFIAPNGSVPLNPYGNTFPAAMTLYQIDPSSRYFGGNPVIVTFDYTEVPMLQKDGSYLVPMQTFCDFFMTPLQYFVQYNGKSTYMMSLSVADNFPDFWKFYNDDTEKREQISDALAQVNYYELCNILEARYGLSEAHNIDSFDAYFSLRGLRGEFLSGSVERIENANNMLGTLLFEDLHSGANSTSPFFDDTKGSLDKVLSPVYENRIKANHAMEEYISNAIGSIMQISGEKMLVTMKNGYIHDIDNGVTPHIPMSANRMFDREYIKHTVNDYFG